MKNGKKRRAWSSVQVRELKTLARKKVSAGKIARRLKRTEGATRQKAFSLGLSLDTRVWEKQFFCTHWFLGPATHVRGASFC
jgi:hypothetical protein